MLRLISTKFYKVYVKGWPIMIDISEIISLNEQDFATKLNELKGRSDYYDISEAIKDYCIDCE